MRQNNFWKRISDAVDLNPEPVFGRSLIEIVGNYAVLIENHCGVISYCTDRICIRLRQGCIVVSGSNMILKRMSKEQLRISGNVRNIELLGKAKP